MLRRFEQRTGPSPVVATVISPEFADKVKATDLRAGSILYWSQTVVFSTDEAR